MPGTNGNAWNRPVFKSVQNFRVSVLVHVLVWYILAVGGYGMVPSSLVGPVSCFCNISLVEANFDMRAAKMKGISYYLKWCLIHSSWTVQFPIKICQIWSKLTSSHKFLKFFDPLSVWGNMDWRAHMWLTIR